MKATPINKAENRDPGPDFIQFESLLAASVKAHGHLCPGQVVGVRMSLLGLHLLGFDAPPSLPQLKKLIVYVELDRCTADAIASVTQVRLGRRSLKFMDYGIMAATFVDLEKDSAYRILSTEESRDLAYLYAPHQDDLRSQQLESYYRMPDAALFRVQRVKVHLSRSDHPGPTQHKALCQKCGQVIRDKKEIAENGTILCLPCAGRGYFEPLGEISWPRMDWSPGRSKLEMRDLACDQENCKHDET